MVAKLRSHLTYANVMVTVLAVLVIGSGSAYAVGKLKANSVGTKQLKPASVTNSKLAESSVDGGNIVDGSVTGGDVVESTLQGVDSGSVGGLQVRKIRFDIPFDDASPATQVLNMGGLVITAVCRTFGDELDVKAFTTKNGASIFLATSAVSDPNDTDATRDIDGQDFDQGQFNTSDVLEVDNNFLGSAGYGIGTLHYEAADGSVIVVHLALSETSGGSPGCTMTGVAIGA